MPRPLREPDIRNPTKTQNNFATLVGADPCVGPLHTCRFRARAHTQGRPYKVGMGSLTDHTSEPGHLYVPRRSFYAISNSVTRLREAARQRALPAPAPA